MTDPDVRTIQVGAISVAIINVGDVEMALAETMDEPAGGWPPAVAQTLLARRRYAQNCIYARVGAISLLVDASLYAVAPDSPLAIAGYSPPVDLLTALAGLGVRPVDVTHMVITHTHHDHFNGLTLMRDGKLAPAFPRARCFVSRADMALPQMRAALQDPASLENRTFGVLRAAGLLDMTEGQQPLAEGLDIIAAPGETAGHQLVRIASGGQALYCVGDLFHDPLEIEQPQYMARWAEPGANLESRRRLVERAAAEQAWVVATHINGTGRIRSEPGGARWEPA